jgi:signal transduction histidine kinase
MNDPEFQRAYEEQNRRDFIAAATLGTMVCIPLNLFCLIMDHFMYPEKMWPFFIARLCSVIVTGLGWFWFITPLGRAYPRFGVMWFLSPLIMILWLIYAANDPHSPYYAGLNIILLGMGLLTPWAYVQNLLVSLFTLTMYVVISFAMKSSQPMSSIMNNTTFLVLTAVLVVSGSVASSRQRFREFTLRYELDKNKNELEKTNRKLVELDRLKSRFFANISHELRTPLTLLLSPLETLLQRFGSTFDDNARELLGTMHANGMRLLKLINDLLDLIRLEAGRMEIKNEPLEISDFIKGLASAARQVAENKHIKLETYTDLRLGVLAADSDKLEKVVLNLLFNALKFTPDGGRVELRAEKQGDKLALIISDNGIGIAEKNLPFIFDRFWQADSSSQRKYQGVGIGLALVKELAEMMHGAVAVESQEGKGTTFTVRLPYQKVELPPKSEADASSKTGAVASEEWLANLYRRAEFFPAMVAFRGAAKPVELGKRGQRPVVLLADDEPDMRRFLRSHLDEHYDVLEAADGVQALEKATQFFPDIILLDMMMPEMDGLDVCRELRKHANTRDIPIILLTARADEETKFNALELGANDFLAKPFSSTELHARIKNLIESHDFQHKLSKQNVALTDTIEQLKETEIQLVQSEKLASLGRMSAGIIHEINNPLNFATTALFALHNRSKHLKPNERAEFEEILNDAEEGIKRVQNIVSDLRVFTHPESGPHEPVNVAEAVNTSLRFLAGEWKDKVRIEQKLPEGQTVWANRNKLVHVLVNLLQNSLDAMRSKKFENEEPAIWIEGRTEGDRGFIVVRDNGTGIKKEHLDKIFDPFFTTKEVGEGMGLGLSICHRIVRGYGGRISAKTEVGRFCELTLDFPAKAEPAAES